MAFSVQNILDQSTLRIVKNPSLILPYVCAMAMVFLLLAGMEQVVLSTILPLLPNDILPLLVPGAGKPILPDVALAQKVGEILISKAWYLIGHLAPYSLGIFVVFLTAFVLTTRILEQRKDSMRIFFSHLGRVTLAVASYGILMILGTMVFVLPAFIVLIRALLWSNGIMQGEPMRLALQSSWRMTGNVFFPLLVLLIILATLGSIIWATITLFIFSPFWYALSWIVGAALFATLVTTVLSLTHSELTRYTE